VVGSVFADINLSVCVIEHWLRFYVNFLHNHALCATVHLIMADKRVAEQSGWDVKKNFVCSLFENCYPNYVFLHYVGFQLSWLSCPFSFLSLMFSQT